MLPQGPKPRPPVHLPHAAALPPQGLCHCDAPFPRALWFYLKAAVAALILKLPFYRLKPWVLRRQGAKIGRNVYISVDVWIDPLFPDLLEIEDDVTIGVGAKIALHEITVNEFRAGRVIIRKGAVIGGFSLVSSGVEIGACATVAAEQCSGAMCRPMRPRSATRHESSGNVRAKQRDMNYLTGTTSTCRICARLLPAQIHLRDGQVWMHKHCPEHGAQDVRISSDAQQYLDSSRFHRADRCRTGSPRAWTRLAPSPAASARHEQHVCMPIIEITDHCDMACRSAW